MGLNSVMIVPRGHSLAGFDLRKMLIYTQKICKIYIDG